MADRGYACLVEERMAGGERRKKKEGEGEKKKVETKFFGFKSLIFNVSNFYKKFRLS